MAYAGRFQDIWRVSLRLIQDGSSLQGETVHFQIRINRKTPIGRTNHKAAKSC